MRAKLEKRIAYYEQRLKRHIEDDDKRVAYIHYNNMRIKEAKAELKRLEDIESSWQREKEKFNFEEITKIILSQNSGYTGMREVFYLNLEKQTFFHKEAKFECLRDEKDFSPKIKIPDDMWQEILVKLKSCEFSTWESSYFVPNLHDFPVWVLTLCSKDKASLSFNGHIGPDGYHIFHEIKNELTENR